MSQARWSLRPALLLLGRQVVPMLDQHQLLLDFKFYKSQGGLKLFLGRERIGGQAATAARMESRLGFTRLARQRGFQGKGEGVSRLVSLPTLIFSLFSIRRQKLGNDPNPPSARPCHRIHGNRTMCFPCSAWSPGKGPPEEGEAVTFGLSVAAGSGICGAGTTWLSTSRAACCGLAPMTPTILHGF